MKKLTLSFIVILSFCGGTSFAQTKCPPKTLYKTNFINDGKDSLRLSFPLFFVVKPDSIIISYDPHGKKSFLAFRVLSKQCFWDDNFTEGKSIFKLILGDAIEAKFPTLVLEENKKQGTYIELLYADSEKRVFSKL